MKVLAQCGSQLMLVADDVELSDNDILCKKCIVVDTDTKQVAPELPIGSWQRRVGPWVETQEAYTQEQIEKLLKM